MSAMQRDGYDLSFIAGVLEGIKRTSQPDGKVTIHDVGMFTDLKTLIASAVKLGKQLPEPVRRKIIYDAVYATLHKRNITAQALLDEIDHFVAGYYKMPEAEYDLITSISVSRHRRLRNAAIAGCLIRFPAAMNKQHLQQRQELLEHAKHSVCGELPRHYTHVKVRVSARSELEAWERGIDAVDQLRAIWNLALNRGSNLRISSGKRQPVNRFVLGPIHTLHTTRGKLATSNWWYQTEYQGPVSAYDPGDSKADRLFKFTGKVRQDLKKSQYKEPLAACLLRYVRALDTPDWEDSYLRLWGVLEQLTNTGIQDNYKVTIRRASFIWKDRKYAQQILTHLRDYRNRAVHAGTESQDIETYMYQLKRIVEALIEFHLKNRFRFETISEVAEFMDLPDDDNELDRRLKIIKAAKLLHGSSV